MTTRKFPPSAFDPRLAQVDDLVESDLDRRSVPLLQAETVLLDGHEARALQNLAARQFRAFRNQMLLVDPVAITTRPRHWPSRARVLLDIDQILDDRRQIVGKVLRELLELILPDDSRHGKIGWGALGFRFFFHNSPRFLFSTSPLPAALIHT